MGGSEEKRILSIMKKEGENGKWHNSRRGERK